MHSFGWLIACGTSSEVLKNPKAGFQPVVPQNSYSPDAQCFQCLGFAGRPAIQTGDTAD
jgi:hypothetical protein